MTKPLTQAQKAAKARIRRDAKAPAARPQVQADAPTPASGALSDMAALPDPVERRAAPMPDNESTMHSGVHDGHDADQHFSGDVHDPDLFPANWAPPAELDAPDAMPNMVQRWVRMSLKGKNDAENLNTMARQGWRPRPLDSVPEGSRKNYSTMKDPRSTGSFLVNKDLVLCHMPKRLFDQMSAYYAAKRKGQVTALVDDGLKSSAIKGAENHGFGAPHVEHRSSNVTTDRVPIVAMDR